MEDSTPLIERKWAALKANSIHDFAVCAQRKSPDGPLHWYDIKLAYTSAGLTEAQARPVAQVMAAAPMMRKAIGLMLELLNKHNPKTGYLVGVDLRLVPWMNLLTIVYALSNGVEFSPGELERAIEYVQKQLDRPVDELVGE